MSDIKSLTEIIIKFRDARDWKQFHSPKDIVMSLVLEATEVMEHFQWKNENEMQKYIKSHKKEIGNELSDVLYWILLISHDLGIDIKKAFIRKMAISNKKYPVKKAKGVHKKYTEL
jgi:NTP pyrophosphatase (non-canonical NTP hydrolase)